MCVGTASLLVVASSKECMCIFSSSVAVNLYLFKVCYKTIVPCYFILDGELLATACYMQFSQQL